MKHIKEITDKHKSKINENAGKKFKAENKRKQVQ